MPIGAEGPSAGSAPAVLQKTPKPVAPAAYILVIDDSPTILRVVELVLKKAGYEVVTATDGQQGLDKAKSRPPDLVLLDFIMPRMNGYQVCKAMTAEPTLKHVPVVLMSAKGDKVGDKFIQVLGIVDYITKPFSPEAVLAVTAHTLEKFRSGGTADAGDGVVLPTDHTGSAAAATAVAPIREESERFVEAMSGDLSVFPIADIMQLIQMEAQTGIFSVRHAERQARVHFRRGRVDLVTAAGLDEEFRLGRYLVEKGFLSQSELEQLLRGRRDGKRRLGGQLVQLGYLTADDLKAAILRQSSEILYEVLRWSSGSFSFAPLTALPEDAVEANLNVSVEGLLMEGYRRIDEWHFIETQIDDFEIVFARSDEVISRVGVADLTKEERGVLDAVDGRRTVRDLIRHTRMGSFNLCKILFRLFSIRVIQRVRDVLR